MGMERGHRASLAIALNSAAVALAVSAVMTSYWCEGTRKVAKPVCTGADTLSQSYCIHFNSSNANDSRLVQYVYETGEDKYQLREFHTGIWFSCEQTVDLVGFNCRYFIDIAPDHEKGVLWLCIVAECVYISLLLAGGGLMCGEMCCCCSVRNSLKLNAFAAMCTALSGTAIVCIVAECVYISLLLAGGGLMCGEMCCCCSVRNSLKLNAFAAMCTALSGLFGMVAHMMFTTAFQVAVMLGPEDWRPTTWDYSWSYLLAWGSFATCMGSAVTVLNRYTKTAIEFKFKRWNIEKNLRIKQRLLELDTPVHLWDTYLCPVSESWDELAGAEPLPSGAPFYSTPPPDLRATDTRDPETPGEEYC